MVKAPNPIISVILPVYNAENTVGVAMRSIINQTFTDFELLVIDDGSTDGTAGVVAEFVRVDSRIKILKLSHQGIVAALQEGLSYACGTFIARMDADDYSDPHRLRKQIQFLEKHPQIGVCSSLVVIPRTDKNEGMRRYCDWLNAMVDPESISLNRFVESPIAHPTVVFRKDLINRYGAYRSGDFPEDYELWLRWMDAGVLFGKVPEILYTWNDSPGRLSRCDQRYCSNAFYRCKAQWLSRWIVAHGNGRRIVIWGAGRVSRKRVQYLIECGISIHGYIDVDKKKCGKNRLGQPVIHYEQMASFQDIFILIFVGNRGVRTAIETWLQEQGYKAGTNYLSCA